jgi:hypothetical protein
VILNSVEFTTNIAISSGAASSVGVEERGKKRRRKGGNMTL